MKRSVFTRISALVFALLLALTGCASGGAPASSPAASAPQSQEAAPAQSQEAEPLPATDFPTKPVEIMVGFSAGGGTHLAAELLTPEAPNFLGQPIQITCKPGAGGAVGATAVATSKADGYTLLYATMSLPISLYMDSVDFDADDFVGVALASDVAPALAVRADAPFDTAEELVEYAKAHPGEFSWGHPGVGSTLHVLGANMLYAMDIVGDVTEIPFAGTSESISAVLGGHIGGAVCFPASLTEQVKAGELKIIGVSSPERIDDLPDAPTFIEQGYNATLTSTRGIFAPASTPPEVLAVLDEAFEKIITSEDYARRGETLGEPPVYANAADFDKMYREQCEMIEKLLKEIGLVD